jgi:glycosyltransferase involved in cell wall biosynthesis
VLPLMPNAMAPLGSVGTLGALVVIVLRFRLFRQPPAPRPEQIASVDAVPLRRVAFVLDGFCGPGAAVCGISRSVEAWIRELLRRGDVGVSLYTAFDAGETLAYFGSLPQLRCYRLDATRIVYAKQPYYAPRLTFANLAVAMQSIANDRPDVVHMLLDMPSQVLFHFAINFTFAPVERPATVGVLHTCAESVLESSTTAALGAMLVRCEQLGSFAFDQVATRSPSFAQRLRDRFDFEFQYIVRPHVDTTAFSSEPEPGDAHMRAVLTFNDAHPQTLLVVYAGRIDPDKRIMELILWCRRAGEHVYLCVVGNGVLASHVARLHGAENRIYCQPGFVAHSVLARYYRAADVHASASLMETLGNTVLESVACGTPVLVPDAQGFRDTVVEGQTGLLVRDSDDAVAKLVRLRDDKTLRATLRARARAHAAHLGVSDTVADLLAWYKRAKQQQVRREMSRSFFASSLMHTAFTLYAGALLCLTIAIDTFLVPWFKRYCERADFAREMAEREGRFQGNDESFIGSISRQSI